MSNDFYCRYGQHWAHKDSKIHTPRQGNYICADCEDKRIQHQSKGNDRNRRFDDVENNDKYQ
jgi:ribosomal protein L37AE/L43A